MPIRITQNMQKLRCFLDKFAQLARILHDRRSRRSWQISTLHLDSHRHILIIITFVAEVARKCEWPSPKSWRQYEEGHGIGEQNDALIIVNQQNLGLNLLAWRSNHWHKHCERKWTLCAHIGKSFTSANNGNFKNLCNFRSWDKIGFSILTELWYRAKAGQAWGGEEEEKLRKVMILFSPTDKQERHTSWMKFFWIWKEFLCVSKAQKVVALLQYSIT